MSKLGLSTVKQCKCLWCVKLRWCQKELIPKSSGQFSNKPIERCSPHRDYFYFCSPYKLCALCPSGESDAFQQMLHRKSFPYENNTKKKKTQQKICVCVFMQIYLHSFFLFKLLYPFRKFGMILKLIQQRVKQCTACWLKPTSNWWAGHMSEQRSSAGPAKWVCEVSDTLSRWIMLAPPPKNT